MPLSVYLLIVLSASFLFSYLARKLYFSEVIGLIIVGIALTVPQLQDYAVAGHRDVIMTLADMGLLALMFLSGLEVSGNMLYREEKDAVIITLSTFAISLLLGAAVMTLLGYDPATSLIVGICLGITAEATKSRTLIQLKKLKTRIGALIMGTGIINDAAGVIFFVFILYIFTGKLVYDEIIILAQAIAAFLAGILVHYLFDRFSQKVQVLERCLLYGVVPFFFIGMGANFHLSFGQIDLAVLSVVFLTASAGQMAGVFITKPLTKLSFKQLYLVGWAMNSRGAVELAIAFIAFRAGFLGPDLYSALVITALVGTILFQLEMFRMIKKYPKIME